MIKNKYLIFLIISSILAYFNFPVGGQKNTVSEITFACEDNNGIPITIAINQTRETRIIFLWKEELMQLIKQTLLELYNNISNNMNDFNISTFGFIAT